jgi:C-8 sterol isomerase
MEYVFEPERLTTIARSTLEQPRAELFESLTNALREAYPGEIAPVMPKWVFNNAGGAMGQMCILHASLQEYLLIFGTPIGTEGHSGRYATDVWDIVLDGEMWGYAEGDMERAVFRPGDVHHLGVNAAKGYRIPDHCWMLEYSRGPIPSMLPFGLADSFFSTLDASVVRRTVQVYGSGVLRSLGNDLRRLARIGARELHPDRSAHRDAAELHRLIRARHAYTPA